MDTAKVVAAYLAIMEEIEKLSFEEMTTTLLTNRSVVEAILSCVSMLNTMVRICHGATAALPLPSPRAFAFAYVAKHHPERALADAPNGETLLQTAEAFLAAIDTLCRRIAEDKALYSIPDDLTALFQQNLSAYLAAFVACTPAWPTAPLGPLA